MPQQLLSEDRRKQLDGIVSQMIANQEPDENIRFVVDDFKKKYGGSRVATASIQASQAGKYPTAAERGGMRGVATETTTMDILRKMVGPVENTAQTSEEKSAFQGAIGAAPPELLERVKGVGRTIAKTGLGAVQYAQHLAGRPVTPIPPSLEPTGDPNEEIGRKVGQIVLTSAAPGAPAKLGRTAGLAVNTAIGSIAGGAMGAAESPEAATAGAVVGGAAPAVSLAVSDLAQYAADKEWAAKLWNQVAKVKAGRSGTQINMQTGEFKTMPGRAMVRASEKPGPLSQSFEAILAKPNDATRASAYRELSQANSELLGKLRQAPTKVDVSAVTSLGSKRADEAVAAAGLPKGAKAVRADIAHKLTQELGDRINWNPNVVTEPNEAMKDAWFAVRNGVNQAAGNVKADYKRWQEAYLFTKALQGTMEKNANKMPPMLRSAAKAAGYVAGGVAAKEAYNIWKSH